MGTIRCVSRLDQCRATNAHCIIAFVQFVSILRHFALAERTSNSLSVSELLLFGDVRLTIGSVLIAVTMHCECATNDAGGIAK